MAISESELSDYLVNRVRGVLEDLGVEPSGPVTAFVRFAEVFDSMAMVEFLGNVAEDCGREIVALETCVGQRFSTVQQLARAMINAGLVPVGRSERLRASEDRVPSLAPPGVGSEAQLTESKSARAASQVSSVLLAGAAMALPREIQSGPFLDEAVGRPVGWLERRAGILQRRVWGDQEPIVEATSCATQALLQAGLSHDKVGALITVSEAPPIAVGLAAAIHHLLGLGAYTPCFEMGGACTGFLSAVSVARALLPQTGPILIVSVEAHSRLLPLVPGPLGEAAALFGDGAAAVVLNDQSTGGSFVKLVDVQTFADGGAGDLVRVGPLAGSGFGLTMEGVSLTEFALHALATATRDIATKHHLSVSKLSAVVAHGGNGRMPAMLARLLHLPATRVWSDVAMTGNLGSASVPVAWVSRAALAHGPAVWTAVGAGLQWGAALWEVSPGE